METSEQTAETEVASVDPAETDTTNSDPNSIPTSTPLSNPSADQPLPGSSRPNSGQQISKPEPKPPTTRPTKPPMPRSASRILQKQTLKRSAAIIEAEKQKAREEADKAWAEHVKFIKVEEARLEKLAKEKFAAEQKERQVRLEIDKRNAHQLKAVVAAARRIEMEKKGEEWRAGKRNIAQARKEHYTKLRQADSHDLKQARMLKQREGALKRLAIEQKWAEEREANVALLNQVQAEEFARAKAIRDHRRKMLADKRKIEAERMSWVVKAPTARKARPSSATNRGKDGAARSNKIAAPKTERSGKMVKATAQDDANYRRRAAARERELELISELYVSLTQQVETLFLNSVKLENSREERLQQLQMMNFDRNVGASRVERVDLDYEKNNGLPENIEMMQPFGDTYIPVEKESNKTVEEMTDKSAEEAVSTSGSSQKNDKNWITFDQLVSNNLLKRVDKL